MMVESVPSKAKPDGVAGTDSPADTPKDNANKGEGPEGGSKVDKAKAKLEAGNIPFDTAPQASAATNIVREDRGEAGKRWLREGRDAEVAVFRDRKRAEYSAANPGSRRRDAHNYAWREALAAFPAPGEESTIPLDQQGQGKHPAPPTSGDCPNLDNLEVSAAYALKHPAPPSRGGESGRIAGLSEMPDDWPELPANASLQAELSWVQANRLLVVEEQSSGATRVQLGRARSPAPSLAALGWLETSIRSYAKFVDVVSRTLKDELDGQEKVTRERKAIDEIRTLLDEMHCDDPAT